MHFQLPPKGDVWTCFTKDIFGTAAWGLLWFFGSSMGCKEYRATIYTKRGKPIHSSSMMSGSWWLAHPHELSPTCTPFSICETITICLNYIGVYESNTSKVWESIQLFDSSHLFLGFRVVKLHDIFFFKVLLYLAEHQLLLLGNPSPS